MVRFRNASTLPSLAAYRDISSASEEIFREALWLAVVDFKHPEAEEHSPRAEIEMSGLERYIHREVVRGLLLEMFDLGILPPGVRSRTAKVNIPPDKYWRLRFNSVLYASGFFSQSRNPYADMTPISLFDTFCGWKSIKDGDERELRG